MVIVAFGDQGDTAAYCGFWGYVADYHAVGAARETAVGDQAYGIAQARADQGGGRR